MPIKDGWTITHDPLYLDMGESITLYVDLGAEKIIGARKGKQQIAVEIKAFTQPSAIHEFHQAIGQFTSYRVALRQDRPTYMLYLAVPDIAYNSVFSTSFCQAVVKEAHVAILVYNVREELIVRWIE
jgi:hypothetical protein